MTCLSDGTELNTMLQTGNGGGVGSAVATMALLVAVSGLTREEEKVPVVATIKKQTLTDDYTVYTLYATGDYTQKIIYVGRVKTANLAARMNYHSAQGRTLKEYTSNLDYATCRVMEQAGMVYYHTINKNNPINNQIRGISPTNKNRHNYINVVFELIGNGLYPDNAIVPLSYWENFAENEFLNLGT